MELKTIDDGNTRFDLVELVEQPEGKITPHCRSHGAMNKVSPHGLWRCLRAVDKGVGEDCRAGCIYGTHT